MQPSANAAQTPLGTDAAGSALNPSDLAMVHPLFNTKGRLPTIPINEIFLVVRQAILLGETGCVFTGHSGIGKTSAINMVRAMLATQYPTLCMHTHDAHNHQIPSIRAFFKHFLSTIGHREQKGETYDLRSRLVNLLIDDARISGVNKVVFFIDEASAMLLTDFLFLKDVHNDLARGEVQLITFLMGQSPDIEAVIANLRFEKRSDLVNRFASRVMPMRCYNSIVDLITILKGIDAARYPAPAGPTWTSFFLSKACAAGFLLANEAPHFYNAITAKATGAESAVRIPARQAFLAVRYFLLTAASLDSDHFKVPSGLWEKAVEYARVQDAILEMEAHEAKRKFKSKYTKKASA